MMYNDVNEASSLDPVIMLYLVVDGMDWVEISMP